ncbi:TetR/AcrR family transcriptional regulator C-terminal domain-containing protein [Virgisporangium ochraceum]|uniref:TetR family transcriptional regulator n=2 Tax=Virgisporangium ochraceum TaxID=65505 RepID=A0A8J4A947_9ACTN|nr:TetR family transcriptional regulator [Virgisporangium ochraceum]
MDADGRPVRPALTRDHIIRTALALLDREGVDGLSMRKLGTELSVNPMAFYHHLPNKAALFDGVVEAVYDEYATAVDACSGDTTGWRNRLEGMTRLFRDTLRRHPHVLLVVATRPSYAPSLMAFSDRTIGELIEPGRTERDVLAMINALRAFTIGHLLAEIAQPIGGPTSPDPPLDERHPHLSRAVASGYDPDSDYEWTLQSMLDGFERRPRPPT